MARFFFNLDEAGTLYEDPEGKECSRSQVRLIALQAARDLMSAEVLRGELRLSSSIFVQDELAQEVMRVPFSEALEFIGLDQASDSAVWAEGERTLHQSSCEPPPRRFA